MFSPGLEDRVVAVGDRQELQGKLRDAEPAPVGRHRLGVDRERLRSFRRSPGFDDVVQDPGSILEQTAIHCDIECGVLLVPERLLPSPALLASLQDLAVSPPDARLRLQVTIQ